MSAGHETSATTLTWAVHVLANRPDVDQRLRREISHLPPGDPDYAGIESLRYLHNFCREVLRVYAPGNDPNIRPSKAILTSHSCHDMAPGPRQSSYRGNRDSSWHKCHSLSSSSPVSSSHLGRECSRIRSRQMGLALSGGFFPIRIPSLQ